MCNLRSTFFLHFVLSSFRQRIAKDSFASRINLVHVYALLKSSALCSVVDCRLQQSSSCYALFSSNIFKNHPTVRSDPGTQGPAVSRFSMTGRQGTCGSVVMINGEHEMINPSKLGLLNNNSLVYLMKYSQLNQQVILKRSQVFSAVQRVDQDTAPHCWGLIHISHRRAFLKNV